MNINALLAQVQTDLQNKPFDGVAWTEAEKSFSLLLQHIYYEDKEMKKYKIKSMFQGEVTKEVSLEWNGNSYFIIYGRYVNGGFFCIPGRNCGGELSAFDDLFWNSESIGEALHDVGAGDVIAKAIAEIELCI